MKRLLNWHFIDFHRAAAFDSAIQRKDPETSVEDLKSRSENRTILLSKTSFQPEFSSFSNRDSVFSLHFSTVLENIVENSEFTYENGAEFSTDF